MKQLVYLSFNLGRLSRPLALDIARSVGCESGVETSADSLFAGAFEATFDADDPRLAALRKRLKREQIEWLERVENIYTAAELRRAPLLELGVDLPPRDVEKPVREQYDFSTGCPRCGAGARQVTPARLRTSRMPTKGQILQSMDDRYFVSESVQAALVKAHLIGLKLIQAVSIKGQQLPWWQLVSDNRMPPMDKTSRGIVRDKGLRGCGECDRNRYAHTADEPSQIVYRRSQLGPGSLPDLTETYECFGISSFETTGYIAHGQTLISPRVYDVLRTLKVRKISLSPVQILND